MTRCSYSQDNKDCGATATKLEETKNPLCDEHFNRHLSELRDRVRHYYGKFNSFPYLIEVMPEIPWGDDWYENEDTLRYALIQIMPTSKRKRDMEL